MDVVKKLLEKGILISPEIQNIDEKKLEQVVKKINPKDTVLTKEIYSFLAKGPTVKIIREYKKDKKPKRITKFTDFYNKRFEFLREILKEKLELKEITSINKLNYNSEAIIIGMVDKTTDNGFELEDSSGSILVKSKEKLLEDEVVGVKGKLTKEGFLAVKIYFPDIPINKKINTTKEDTFALFTQKLNKKPEQVSYIFVMEPKPEILKELKCEVVTTQVNINAPNISKINLPAEVDVQGVKIFIYKQDWTKELANKTGENDLKKLMITMLKKRHFLPFEYTDEDPYLLKEIPDIIFVTGLNEALFLNYKGVSIISATPEKGVLVNLKTREFEEIADI